jgi:hypothetical protein
MEEAKLERAGGEGGKEEKVEMEKVNKNEAGGKDGEGGTYGCVQKVCVPDFEICNDGITREWTSKWHRVPGTDFLDTAILRKWKR